MNCKVAGRHDTIATIIGLAGLVGLADDQHPSGHLVGGIRWELADTIVE